MSEMTKSERNDLASLVRQRAKLLKAIAAQRSAELLANFEHQLGSIHAYDDDEVWETATVAAQQAVDAARAQIAERCRELGIPKEFAPTVSFSWYGRGQNGSQQRRTELRRMATTKIAALEKAAQAQIQQHSLDTQEKLIVDGLSSDAANQFLAELPAIETLMPPLDAAQIKGLIEGTKS